MEQDLLRFVTSLFPRPELVEPQEDFENDINEKENLKFSESNGELFGILDGYTYEIRGIDSGRIEVIPHRKIGNESGIKLNYPKEIVRLYTF